MPSVAHLGGEMPPCWKCGTEVVPGDSYCTKCGTYQGAGPSPYGMYPPTYPMPAKSSDAALVVLLVVILLVAIVVLPAVFYVLVSGLISGPGLSKPVVMFGTPTATPDGELIPVASATPGVSPTNYRINLRYEGTIGIAVAAPRTLAPSYLNITGVAGFFQVSWTDIGGDRILNSGDYYTLRFFTRAGMQANLPLGSYVFYLLWSDGSEVAQVSFQVA